MIMNIKGWVSGDWVPTKNSYGLIVIVQQQVTNKVCSEMAGWREYCFVILELKMSDSDTRSHVRNEVSLNVTSIHMQWREEETDGGKKANSHHSNGPCKSTGKFQECRKSVVRSVLKSCGALQQLRELQYPKCGILCCSVEQRSSVLISCF
ncbi:hypothetical protein ACE6H2_005991 [Prunus campanulata]